MSKIGLDNERSGKCFVCWEVHELNKTFSSTNLNGQLSVVLLLRKILGIRQDVLSNLISVSGNPGDWGVKLCSPCARLFREAHYIHERLLKLRSDFEGLAKELRSLLLKSFETDVRIEKNDKDETEYSTTKRRKVGRSEKRNIKPRARDESLTPQESANVLQSLRQQFVEGGRSNLLDLSEPTALYTTSINEDSCVLTSVPITLRVTESSFSYPEKVAIKTELQTKDHEDSTTDNFVDHFDDELVETVINDTGDNVSTCNKEMSSKQAPQEEEKNNIDKEVSCTTESLMGEEDGNDSDHDSAKLTTRNRGRPRSTSKKLLDAEKQEVRRKRSMQKFDAMITESFSKVPLELDIQPTTENNRFKCTQCGCQFEKKFDCCIHMLKDHHEDPMPYHCHICTEKRFHSEEKFRNHMIRFHHGVMCPFDEDYDPALHSAEKLLEKVISSCSFNISDSVDQPSQMSEQNEEQFLPNFPEEVLAKIRDSPNEIFKCRQCSWKFRSELRRIGHEKRVHKGILRPFDCDYCQRSFDKRVVYIQHLALAHFSSQVSCPLCGLKFPEKTMLQGHVRRVHVKDKAKVPFECTSCHRKFVRRAMLNLHMKQSHGTKIRVTSTSRRNMNRRKLVRLPEVNKTEGKGECMQANHAGTKRPYKCPVKDCKKTYISQVILNNHIANVHKRRNNSDLKEFPCSHCGLTFTEQRRLDEHIPKHGVSPYICTFCGKQFKEKYCLLNHEQQMHYKELNLQPHKCDICAKVLNNERSLKNHMLVVHIKQPKYKCNQCDYGSMSRVPYENHVKAQHLKIKTAICPVCSATFAYDYQLTTHMRVHSGEKPYKCIECGKAFSDGPTFNRHKEAHKGRIHKCPLDSCPKQFNTRHAFRIHLKQHQKKGIAVEIPEFRYETEEIDQSLQKSGTFTASDNSTNSEDVDSSL